MKPDFEVIPDLKSQSFLLKHIVRKNRTSLSAAWHYHPEIEICYTKMSTGKRHVGNQISNYEEGDLVMFGSYLPHGFTTTEKTKQVVLQFKEDLIFNSINDLKELSGLKDLFENAKMGLEIKGDTKNKVVQLINRLEQYSGLRRIIKLFELLLLIEDSGHSKPICTKKYSASLNLNQLGRMKVIFDYLENNFRRNITISDAANMINLTDSAFYKFIKRHTKKKFTQLLVEYRLEHAAKNLANTKMTIAEICFDSGFKNLSYFNRRFKEAIQLTPSKYREQFERNK